MTHRRTYSARNSRNIEDEEQKKFCAWALDWGLAFWHTPNELLGVIRGLVGQKAFFAIMQHQKAMGTRPGIPDIYIISRVPGRPEIRGVAIEMKTETGTVSPTQKTVRKVMEREGIAYHVARKSEAAKRVAKGYWSTPVRVDT